MELIGIPICTDGLDLVVDCTWESEGPVVFVAVMMGGRKLNGGIEGVIGGRP